MVPSFLQAEIWAQTAAQPNAINQIVNRYKKDEFDCTVRISDSECVTGGEQVFLWAVGGDDGYVHICV